jgi:hypothetical protein
LYESAFRSPGDVNPLVDSEDDLGGLAVRVTDAAGDRVAEHQKGDPETEDEAAPIVAPGAEP